MSKFNLLKAKKKLRDAENEALRDEILSFSENRSTREILADFYAETGWKRANLAKYMGYSANAVKRWEELNENTTVIKCVCDSVKRRYWHHRNKERYQFEFDSENE